MRKTSAASFVSASPKMGSHLDSYGLNRILADEEFLAEKRINRIIMSILSVFIPFSLVLPFLTASAFRDPNNVSNLTALGIFLIYTLANSFLLRRGFSHWIVKYVTMFFTITTITIAVYGYHYGVDFVHTVRTVAVVFYFPAIILSGQYHNPRVCIYASVLSALEYTFLVAAAWGSGLPIYLRMETFRENILTLDIVVVYILLFATAGFLMYLNSRRQKQLLADLRLSSEHLNREREKASFLENYDELTQLPNVKWFGRELTQRMEAVGSRGGVLTVMCLGLDSFKNLNQLHGAQLGDSLLKAVGDRLRETLRKDDIVSRFMGDKFLILFNYLKSGENVSILIRKTRQIFDMPFPIESLSLRVSCSAGICSFPHDGVRPDDLIEKAESAMYHAKAQGKNRFYLYERDKQAALERRIQIETALENAVEKDEFSLVYQPKVNSRGEIFGMESLIRWTHPDLGAVPPGEFIPIAERTGAISAVGYWVFSECFGRIRSWIKEGLPFGRISVNVSPEQFSELNFVPNLLTMLREYGISPESLELELTESGLMMDESDCAAKLSEIKAAGILLSIDDFGKGYSSLTRLGRYPLDALKIDKSFIDGLPEDRTSVCLVRSILDLAANLGYDVLAEGVETEEQVRFLEDNGCRSYQGFFFYRPLSEMDAVELLLKGKGR